MRAAIDAMVPPDLQVVLLADRVHTGEPFLACLDALGWYYVFRANESTQISTQPKDGCP